MSKAKFIRFIDFVRPKTEQAHCTNTDDTDCADNRLRICESTNPFYPINPWSKPLISVSIINSEHESNESDELIINIRVYSCNSYSTIREAR